MALTKVDDRGLKTPIDLLDDEKIRLGTDNDLQLYHSTSNHNWIDADQVLYARTPEFAVTKRDGTEFMGRFIADGAVELYYDSDLHFATTSQGCKTNGDLSFQGDGGSEQILFDASDNSLKFVQDQVKLKIGAGNDLQLYHNGSNSYLKNTTGWLNVLSDTIFLGNAADSEAYLKATNNGAVELYYDNVKKFETISSGASVTGSLGVGTTSPARLLHQHVSDSSATYHLFTNSTTGSNATDGLLLGINSSEEAIIWNYENTDMRIATNNSDCLTIKSDGNVRIPADNKKLQIGASQDLQIYHDGSNSRIVESSAGQLVLQSSHVTFTKSDDSEFGLRFIEDAAVELYYDGSKKFETTSDGATITGNIKPDADSTRFLGSNSVRFSKVFADVYEGSAENLTGIFVTGMIMLWSGATNAIPTGWLLCNGSNSTPDLRDRFVIGAGNNYAVGATGGSADATLVSHSHTTNTTINPSDTNTKDLQGTISAVSETFGTSSGTATGIFTKISNVSGQHTPSGVDTSGSGAFNIDARHRHGTDTQGSSATNANLPPYYALCYIMKS